MKRFLKILTGFALFIGLICLLLVVSGNGHILNGIGKTYFIGETRPDIDDMHRHELRKVPADSPLAWEVADETYDLTSDDYDFAKLIESTAFLVVHDGKILCEQYWEGTDANTYSNSFSMAKSFAAMAVAHAHEAGLISSLDAPVCSYLPEYCADLDQKITIRHLLQMASGIDFGESYANPFGYQAKAYYGTRLTDVTLEYNASAEPGSVWKYEGGNSVLLALVLQKATGQRLSEYFAKHIWAPLGAEQDAYWNLDRENGMEKAFSGFYAGARDYARVGQMYLDSGLWNGSRILSKEWVEASTTPVMIPDVDGVPYEYYGLHWWLGELDGQPFYSCRGMRGQYIVCIPHLDAVFVRLGHDRIETYENGASLDLWRFLEITKSIVNQHERRTASAEG